MKWLFLLALNILFSLALRKWIIDRPLTHILACLLFSLLMALVLELLSK